MIQLHLTFRILWLWGSWNSSISLVTVTLAWVTQCMTVPVHSCWERSLLTYKNKLALNFSYGQRLEILYHGVYNLTVTCKMIWLTETYNKADPEEAETASWQTDTLPEHSALIQNLTWVTHSQLCMWCAVNSLQQPTKHDRCQNRCKNKRVLLQNLVDCVVCHLRWKAFASDCLRRTELSQSKWVAMNWSDCRRWMTHWLVNAG